MTRIPRGSISCSPSSPIRHLQYVVPEIHRRGVYRTEYTPGKLRHMVFGKG
ncbi:hypothetical protein NY08_595 [Rhodococcus sp. B7740]|nr:hypothetical protein NY08_595 [Rhodococcus sp. B7740]